MGQAWQLRPVRPDDMAGVVEVIRAEDLRYRGRVELDVQSLAERNAADPSFDAERDQVVAELDGTVVAAAIVRSRGAFLAVHPDHDEAGLREAVLSWVEARSAALGRECEVAVPAATTPTVALLQRCGYRRERFYAEMVRDFALTGAPEPATVPDGYRLRPVDPRADAATLHALDDRAFRDRPDFVPESPEHYERSHLSLSLFAASWSLVIESDAGQPAGSLLGARRPGHPGGYIAVLAVDPDHRRRGIARALLLTAFDRIRAAGLESAELHVASDNPRALDLYTGVGMRAGERFDHYVRVA